MKSKLLLTALSALLIGAIAPSAFADPYCRACPMSCSVLGLGNKDCDDISGTGGLCCVDLNSKGQRIAQERENALAQSAAQSAAQNSANERCPAGFQPSENKCSQEERRRGCKDVRLNNGLGCVRR